MFEMILMILFYLLLGAFAGILAGTLGVGGGVILVPGLLWLFGHEHMAPDLAIHVAVGTSLAIMCITSLRSFISHRRHQVPYWDIFKPLLPGIVVGVIVGSFIGHYLHSRMITIIFGFVQLILGIYMLISDKIRSRGYLPGVRGLNLLGGVAGTFAGLLGVGGGSILTPVLIYCEAPIRKAVMVSVITSFVVATIGTLTAMLTGALGTTTASLIWNTGYVYWPAWFGVVVGSLCFIPLGVSLSHRLPVTTLRRFFALFLMLVAIDLLSRSL
jgi:uncharacterized membrane protein YfcA